MVAPIRTSADPATQAPASDPATRAPASDPATRAPASDPATQAPASDPRPAPDPDGARFREAMSHLASGVVLVTASVDGRPWGMTVSAACPVCVEPPTMLVSLGSHTALAKAVAETGRYGVNILGTDALDIARFGSAVGAAKFLDEGAGVDLSGLHPAEIMVDGALGHVDCEVVDVVAHGTHSLFLGRVRAVRLGDSTLPLVHYRREFWRVGEAA